MSFTLSISAGLVSAVVSIYQKKTKKEKAVNWEASH